MLHVDAQGRLLGPPVESQVEIPLGPLHSPDHPTKDPAAGLVQRDGGGFAGLTLDNFGRPVAVLGRPPRGMEPALPFQIFDLAARAAGVPWVETAFYVPLTNLPGQFAGGLRVGELADVPGDSRRRFLVLASDGAEPPRRSYVARFMAQYDRRGRPEHVPVSGAVVVADLLALADPHDLDGDGRRDAFRLDARDPAALLILDDRTVLVATDNGHTPPPPPGDATTPGEPTRLVVVRAPVPFAALRPAR